MVSFMFGSSLAHGDHRAQAWKSWIIPYTTEGGADIVAERSMVNASGLVKIKTDTMPTKTTKTMRIFRSMLSTIPPFRRK